MDLKVLADGVMSLPNMTSLLRDYWFVLLIAAPFLFPGVVKGAVAAMKAGFSENWQLALLGSTAIALSLASGWTTWDGMRNFTGEPILSVHGDVRHPGRDVDHCLADRRELRVAA